jgi:Fic family protein
LKSFSETAQSAIETAKSLLQQAENDRGKLQIQGRLSGTLLKLHHALVQRSIATSAWLQKETALAPATIQSGILKLVELKIVEELTGKQRDRIYAYQNYISILSRCNELPK